MFTIPTADLKRHVSAASKLATKGPVDLLKSFCFRNIEGELWLLSTDGTYSYGGLLGRDSDDIEDHIVSYKSLSRILSVTKSEAVELDFQGKKVQLSGGGTFSFQTLEGEFPYPDVAKVDPNTTNLLSPAVQEKLKAALTVVGEDRPWVLIGSTDDEQFVEVLTTNSCYRASIPFEPMIPGSLDFVPEEIVRSFIPHGEAELSVGANAAFGESFAAVWRANELPYPNTDDLFRSTDAPLVIYSRMELLQGTSEAAAVNALYVTLVPEGIASRTASSSYSGKLGIRGDFPEKEVHFRPDTLVPFLSSWTNADFVSIEIKSSALVVRANNGKEVCCIARFLP